MINQKLHNYIKILMKRLHVFADRIWFPPLIGLLAAIDNFILIIPNDGILISSSMLIPKRWFIFAVNVTVGSTIGALALASLVEIQGLPWLLEIYPDLNNSEVWRWTDKFFDEYGLLLVFVIGLTPLTQQPAVVLAGLANSPLFDLVLVIFFSRFIKFIIMAYIGSHAPRLLSKFWGIKEELEDVGIKLK